jgi:hypothetical protein
VLLPALIGVATFAGMLLIMQSPAFITKSTAFSPGGYLQGYSAEGYYQLVISLLAIVAGGSTAAFVVGIRASWYPYAVVRTREISRTVANWLATIVILCFIGSLFLLILPVSELGSLALLIALSVSFGLVGHFSHWASGLPEELLSAMEADAPLQSLQALDLETSAIKPMMDSEENISPRPPAGSMANAGSNGSGHIGTPVQSPSGRTLSSAPPGFDFSPTVWRDLILAAVPAFFGLMGLAQLREGRWSRGVAFLVSGLVLGGLSSWVLILPSRIGEFFSSQPMPSVTSFSWLYSSLGGSATSSWVISVVLGGFLLVWIVQLLDTVTYIRSDTVERDSASHS